MLVAFMIVDSMTVLILVGSKFTLPFLLVHKMRLTSQIFANWSSNISVVHRSKLVVTQNHK